jgi:hypothetical protein
MFDISNLSTMIATLSGGALSIFGGILAEKSRSKSDSVTRHELRKEKILIRRLEFQQNSLIELQDEIEKLTIEIGQELVEILKSEQNKNNHISKFMKNPSMQSMQRIRKLIYRINNDQIRGFSKNLIKIANEVLLNRSPNDDNIGDSGFSKIVQDIYEQIGIEINSVESQVIDLLSKG